MYLEMDFKCIGQEMYTPIKKLWMLNGMPRMNERNWSGFFFSLLIVISRSYFQRLN